MLALTTLGTLVAAADSPDGTRHLGRGKPVALLAFLSAAPGRRASRERLATLLWSEGSSEQARQNLRQTLWYLRRRLGACVIATDDFVELAPETRCDRDHFLMLVREQRLAEAVDAYAGEFVPDFAAPGAAEFEAWADVERRRLRAVFVGCCDTLARQALGGGHFASAVALARRARDEAPLDLTTWRLLLEALVAAREPVAALAEVEHLEAFLATEELEQDDATRAAVRAARAVGSRKSGGTDSQARDPARAVSGDEQATLAPELIGREHEFRSLLERWESARLGRGGAVLVTGVAGLGKSRLLADLHARLRASRARAVFIRANPGDRAVGGGFIAAVAETIAQRPGAAAISAESASVLVALAPALASSFPHSRPDSAVGEDATRRRVGALLDLLRAVSEEAALALFIDDIHWTDPESRRVLDAVTARLDGGRVLIVLAARPPLEALGGFTALARVDLPRFDLQRVAEFIARLGELPADAHAAEFPAQLLAATRGLPLTLIEALQRLLESGALVLQEHTWRLEQPGRIAELLRDGLVLESRVRSLAAGAHELLLLLATIGRPVPATALPGGGAGEDLRLGELEHRGFVARGAGSFEVAHDEIGAAALASATEEERREAHRRAARLLADLSPESDLTLTLAADHARLGEDASLLRGLVRRYVARQRAEGDGAPARALVATLLGPDAPRATREMAMRVVPWHQRPARRTRQVVAAGLIALFGVVGWAGWNGAVPPDFELIIRTDDPQPRYLRVRIPELERWQAGEPLEAYEIAAARLPAPLDTVRRLELFSLPDGSGWVGGAYFPDSGADEMVIALRDGNLLRPASAEGDDGSAAASPDGRFVVFSSSRWHPTTDIYNIARLDRQTGEVTRLVASEDFLAEPRWSPDGTRIAYHRNSFTEPTPHTVCVAHADGAFPRCDWTTPPKALTLVDWTDDTHVLVKDISMDTLYTLDVETGELARFGVLPSANRTADRRVIAGFTDGTRDGVRAIALARADRRGPPRPVLERGRPVTGLILLSTAARATRYVERVALAAPPAGVPVDLTYALRAEAFDSGGRPVPARAVRFRSLDESIGVVVDGVFRPRRVGLARVEVSVGGWRTDTGVVRVVPSTVRQVIVEHWTDSWPERWRRFGDPYPVLGRGDGGATLLPNGDGSYGSGVYLPVELDPREGIGLEFRASIPMTRFQWQSLDFSIMGGVTPTMLRAWDHVSGTMPVQETHLCASGFGGDGGSIRLFLTVTAGGQIGDRAPTPDGLYSGRWMTVRLQLFPDGRCGLAIDGRPIALSRRPRPVAAPALLRIGGHTVGTTVQVGRLELWRGVRGGVDWEAVSH